VRTLLEARLRITCPAFATPEPPETIDLADGGSGRGWQVLVAKEMPTLIEGRAVEAWTLHKLVVEPKVTPASFYLTSAYDLAIGMPKQLWIHETVWRVIGERSLAAPIEFPAGAHLKVKLGLEDSYLAERLRQFHGPVDLRVALIGEEKR